MKIKIKTWDKMVEQFGLTMDGTIDYDSGFTPQMENALPFDRIININGRINDDMFIWQIWSISQGMIEEFMDKRYTIYGELINVS